MDSAILSKIKKLLALAKSNNPYEAAAALSRAQALMQKHGVGEADIAMADCDTQSLCFSKEKLTSYDAWLLSIIETSFGVVCVVDYLWHAGKYVARANLMGMAPQPELAMYCLDVLQRQLLKARAEYVATLSNKCKRLTKIKRGDDFCKGWVFAVQQKIVAFAMTEQQRALVDQYKSNKFGNTSTQKSLDRNNGKARADDVVKGMRSAKNVYLDRPMHGKETPKLTGASV
jgi:hypothetical protein